MSEERERERQTGMLFKAFALDSQVHDQRKREREKNSHSQPEMIEARRSEIRRRSGKSVVTFCSPFFRQNNTQTGFLVVPQHHDSSSFSTCSLSLLSSTQQLSSITAGISVRLSV